MDEELSHGGQRVQLFDTPLLDDAGVDIELPGGHAMIISRISSLHSSEDAHHLARKLTRLSALGRYAHMDVILCADVDISQALSVQISFIQNAVVRHTGSLCCPSCFQIIAPRLVAAVVASRALHSLEQRANSMDLTNEAITDMRVQERVSFLLSIAPSLTVYGALQCLGTLLDRGRDDDFSRESFQRLMTSGTTQSRHVNLVETEVAALHQLSFAINVPLSNDA